MGEPDLSPRKLAIELGAGLDASVPHDVEISVVETVVRIRKRGTPWGMDADMRPPRVGVDEAADLLVGILDQAQDQVAETIAEPWPAVAPAEMPEPFAEVRDGRLIAGFGDPADPALMVLSAALRDLR